MTGITTLLMATLLVRFVPEKKSPDLEWSGLWEAVITILVGVAFALLGTFWFSRFHIVGETLSSDLYDFCGSVAAMRDGVLDEYSRDRSLAAGYLPAYLSEFYGVSNGLAISSIFSLGVIGSGLYLWARALSSRLGGVLAALFGLSLAPVVLLGRTLTFYPEYVAVFTLASGLVCLAVKQRRPLYYLLGGLGIAACLLIDLRGIVWAVPLACAGVVAALVLFSKRSWILIGLLFLPVIGSWFAGAQVYTSRSTPLEAQANPVRLFYEHGTPSVNAPPDRPQEEAAPFIWGRTPISTVPTTLYNLFIDTKEVSPLMSDERVVVQGRDQHLSPLLYIGIIGFFGALISTIRKPLMLSTLMLTSAPFLVVLYHASHLEFRPRFAASALPVLAVFFGLAMSWVINLPLPKIHRLNGLQERFARIPRVRAVLLFAVTSAAVTGVLPSTLGPDAEWRIPFVADNELERMISAGRNGTTLEVWGSQTCIDGLAADIAAGRPVGATIFAD